MLTKKGFTLVELMVVILIVAILAAIAIPIMRGRIDSAKWTEGKAMIGTIATSIRAHVAEKNEPISGADKGALSFEDLGLLGTDFEGTYFLPTNFDWLVNYNVTTNTLDFSVIATNPPTINSPGSWTLYQNGKWEADAGVGP